jgi:mersacidin/lichenicidin family type 2 lantibiotic
MTNENIVRAWKDPAFRRALSDETRAALPEHPAGLVEIDSEALNQVSGNTEPIECITLASFVLQCWQSAEKGTCGWFSWGCCGSVEI